jgi:hypothetical protein
MAQARKIEGSGLEDEILKFANQGYSSAWIAKHCESKGLVINHQTVTRFLIRKEVKTNGKKATYDKTLHSERVENRELKPVEVDVEAVLNRYKIAKQSNNINDVIDAVQKLSYAIFCIESANVLERLEMHSRGEGTHPNEHLRGYRIAFEVLQNAWGYEQVVNVGQAIKTLEAQGYQIQG